MSSLVKNMVVLGDFNLLPVLEHLIHGVAVGTEILELLCEFLLLLKCYLVGPLVQKDH